MDLYPHDLHPLVVKQYQREDRWPEDWELAPRSRADAGLIFHEKHMLSDELRLLNRLGETSAREMITLDDVPLTSLYRAP